MTARGWEDLSATILLCEEENLPVDETLVAQYLHNEKIVKEFTAYYELYNKYKKDYKVEEILDGTNSAQVVERARIAKFDERLSLLGMVLDKLESEMKENLDTADYLSELMRILKAMRTAAEKTGKDVLTLIHQQIEARNQLLESMAMAGTLSTEEKRKSRTIVQFLEAREKQLRLEGNGEPANSSSLGENDKNKEDTSAFALLKAAFDKEVAAMRAENEKIQSRLHNVFAFSEVAFMDGNEMTVLVTELTVNTYSARFIGTYGSADYQRHNEDLMLGERQDDILQEIERLAL